MHSLVLTSVTPTCLKLMGQQFGRMTLGLNLPGIFFLNPRYDSLSEESREDSDFFIESYQVWLEHWFVLVIMTSP